MLPVSLIGAETIRSLTLSIHVFSQFDRNSGVAAYLPTLWEHSVAVASLAQRIAMLETGSKSMAEECFTAGLLHDIGKIVLLAELPQEYKQVMDRMNGKTRSIRPLELEFLGCPHEQVGAYLMSIWGLPISIVEAVQFHHTPSETPARRFSASTAVHCADAIASSSDESPLNRDLELDIGYLERIGMSEKAAVWKNFQQEYLAIAASRKAELVPDKPSG